MGIIRFLSLCSTINTTYRNVVNNAFSPKYLLYTNVFLSVGISTLGDIIEQSREFYSKEIEEMDVSRTAHMAFTGSIAGVFCHNWYIFLDKIIIGKSLGMVLKKLMLDQFICSPSLIMIFFISAAIFEEDPIENFNEEVRTKFWRLYVAEWVVWPPAQIINFYFLPTRYRVLYDNTISLGYDIYTSQVKHEKPWKEEVIEESHEHIHEHMHLNDKDHIHHDKKHVHHEKEKKEK